MDDYDESLDIKNRRVEIDLRCQLMNPTDEMNRDAAVISLPITGNGNYR